MRHREDKKEVDQKGFFVKLDENSVLKLPTYGPIGRRIYVKIQLQKSEETRELFIQRNDAFATNLFGLFNSLRAHEVTEIRYFVGFDGVIRIFLGKMEKLSGEYFCKSQNALVEFKEKMKMA